MDWPATIGLRGAAGNAGELSKLRDKYRKLKIEAMSNGQDFPDWDTWLKDNAGMSSNPYKSGS